MMGKFSPHPPHRSQPLMISAGFCAWFDAGAGNRVSFSSPPQGHTKSSRRVNFIEISTSEPSNPCTRVTCCYSLEKIATPYFD